jgi:hypothetical protein
MLLRDPQPSPKPVVTVTETVTVPTSVPTPTIAPPEAGLDFWKDIIFGDFMASIVAAGAAIGVAVWLMRHEREVRLEERRRDKAEGLRVALVKLSRTLRSAAEGSHSDAWNDAVEEMFYVVYAGHRDDPDRAFRNWMEKRREAFSKTWNLPDDARIEEQRNLTTKMLSGLTVWIDDPEKWRALSPEEVDAYIDQASDDLDI